MSKHKREDEEDVPLSNSIKRLKIDHSEEYASAGISNLAYNDLAKERAIPQREVGSYVPPVGWGGDIHELQLQQMNHLLNSLHWDRCNRLAEKNAKLPTEAPSADSQGDMEISSPGS
jgi:hypothetical protein